MKFVVDKMPETRVECPAYREERVRDCSPLVSMIFCSLSGRMCELIDGQCPHLVELRDLQKGEWLDA